MEHNGNSRNAIGSEWGAADLLDTETADKLEAQHILDHTGKPPNPPRPIEDYYRDNRPSDDDLVVVGFMLGVLYLGALTIWREFVKSRG